MTYGLLILSVISFVYCCDLPVWQGFEFLVNDHDSLIYTIGVSIIASYIFYCFEVVVPREMRFRKTQSIAVDRLYKIEKTMYKMLCCLQGEIPNPGVNFSKESIDRRLAKLGKDGIFGENSRYEIRSHKELSIFEALVCYDDKIMKLADEIIAGQYLKSKYEKKLLRLKNTKLHEKLEFWYDCQPGEYERRNQKLPGHLAVAQEVVNTDIVSSVDEYIELYECIKKMREEQYYRLHRLLNEIMNKFLHV